MKKKIKRLKDVAPELIKEWHFQKNKNVNFDELAARTKTKYWWQCRVNKKHEWEACTDNRVRGTGCPYCAGRLVLREESFAARYPSLVEEWDYKKNNDLSPFNFTAMSNISVWWRCRNDESHCWKTPISKRSTGSGCPYCAGQKLCSKRTLAVCNPVLAIEWHPTLNKGLSPDKISIRSDKSVWWQCRNDSSHKPWKAQVKSRNTQDAGCPECRPRPSISYEDSLEYKYPHISAQLHPELNGGLTGKDVTPGSGELMYWVCNINSKHVWKTRVAHRTAGHGCRFCSTSISKENRRIYAELREVLKNLDVELDYFVDKNLCVDVAIPSLKVAIEWDSHYHHKDKVKADLKKTKKLINMGYKLIRLRSANLPWDSINNCVVVLHDDHLNLSHVQDILVEIVKNGLDPKYNLFVEKYLKREKWLAPDPTLTDEYQLKLPPKNRSLQERFVDHSKFWDDEKNGELLPVHVYGGSHQVVNWKCAKVASHRWDEKIASFTSRQPQCLFCSKLKPSAQYNFKSNHPELMKEWAFDLNKGIDPSSLSPGSGGKVWWRCLKGHEWRASLHNRRKGTGCPYCNGRKVSKENCLLEVNPSLAEEWHYEFNNPLTPKDVTRGSHKKVWWRCSLSQKHVWQSSVNNRSKGRGCPHCAKEKRRGQ